MARARANGIEIEYETRGNPGDRPLLMINGLATQLINWDPVLLDDLVRTGHYVIIFDNRDTGLSTKCGSGSSYTLHDMADDTAGLLDALAIDRAHICGTSMGGMIAQTLAIDHPSRAQSLISIYSTTGNRDLPEPDPLVIGLLLTPAPRERAAYVAYMTTLYRAMAGKGFVFDEEWARQSAAKAYDRSFCPEGTARQAGAVALQEDRRKALASLRLPALVIHGTEDPVIRVEAGRDTARAVPGAQLILIEGMGHDMPHGGAWPRIVEAIAHHTARLS